MPSAFASRNRPGPAARIRRGLRAWAVGAVAVASTSAASVPARAVTLTPTEQAYLRDNPVVPYCADPDWEPYEVITEEGWHRGIAADLLRLAASRVGMTLAVVPTRTWEESIEKARSGACKFLSFLNRTPKRDEWLNFTAPLFIDPNVIVTREEHPLIDDLGGLTGSSVVLPTGTSIEERLRHDFPNLILTAVPSEADAFAMVSEKKASMTMRSLTVAVHAIKKGGWFNLKVAGTVPGYENSLRVGVVKNEPTLRDILDKGVAAVGADERERIANRHVAITVQQNFDYELLWTILAACGLAAGAALFQLIKLRKNNQRLERQSHADALTGLGNRRFLNDRLALEIVRAQHHDRPFSILLLAVDHLTAVDDLYGRATADAVLRRFAEILRENLRVADMAGRWSGDEFLILCPETTAEQALELARRLCAAVRGRRFPTGHTHTLSAGTTALRRDDSEDALLRRADAALSLARSEGRDRAILDAPE